MKGAGKDPQGRVSTATCIMCFEAQWGVVVEVGGCRERSERSVKLEASLVTAVSRLVNTVTFHVSVRS